MPNFCLTLEYDGRRFAGWQLQAQGERTVQACLVDAIEAVTGLRVALTGSGRTDAGVHAEGQVASARIETALAPERLRAALNANLDDDLAVTALEIVPDDFDARRSVRSKLYRYRIWNGPQRSPLRAGRAAFVPGRPLDLPAMRSAAARLVGERDFASFQAAGSSVQTTRRCLERLDVEGAAGGEIWIDAQGTGFLRHMVRTLAGTLIEVGQGRRLPESMEKLLEARDRARAGPTAPAEGLTLVWVRYAEPGMRAAEPAG